MAHIGVIIYLVGVVLSALINFPTHKKTLDCATGHVSLIALSLTSWIFIIALVIDLLFYIRNRHENI